MKTMKIKLKNGKIINSIDELNENIQTDNCGVCWKENNNDNQCKECILGDNYVSYFKFVGIEKIECIDEECFDCECDKDNIPDDMRF